ncbi:Cytochrome c oxidase subunit III [Rubritalea squalenifaciens DSM 18772]|uniref:Cytochrome c oxidase subunit III n=1 Tax=Rubritalea squalenifaciens DSM 18772 TaxID=1123071 RepID=A0A1M6P6V2_9BACT|nr:cytochrome c oxidase subunit 3 [Rubritalea squalenifaciens]SHK03635.1 Cytochrome c oxidase subunit III [Rubritalea squalenifaciens DSM 18772]
MEIPYIVNARKDTGLNNSKIAIWLFLASEVMLFGGLFSSYIFLRIFADYPWPERALPVLPGLLNTFILIASSVTVVFAWAALKLRKWGMFVGNMSFTIICAAVFMVFKAYEYSAKFHHHAIQTQDYGIIEGHLHGENNYVVKSHEEDGKVIPFEVNISLSSYYDKYITSITEQAGEGALKLNAPFKVSVVENGQYSEQVLKFKTQDGNEVEAVAGTTLSFDLLQSAKAEYIKARTHNQELRAKLLRDAWAKLREDEAFKKRKAWESEVKAEVARIFEKELVADAKEQNMFLLENGNMTFSAEGEIKLDSGWGRMEGKKEGGDTKIALLDSTVLSGKAGDAGFHIGVDALDFRHLVMKAEEKGLDADALIEKSIYLKNDQLKQAWEAHKKYRAFFAEYLAEERGRDENGNAKYVPTAVDNYRVTWKQLVAYHKLDYDINEDNWQMAKGGPGTGEYANKERVYPTMIQGFTGANHKQDDFVAAFPEMHIHREDVRFDSVFSPKMNNYYAIYFTITGLHGLHVIGGAIVLGYYLFFGRKMYLSNPEWLANRVEVGGLFWHFVDLVWIFVFPIFYLM